MNFKNLLLMAMAAGFLAPASAWADDYVDDIYFNPKKDTNVGAKKKNPNYIENFSDMDVDTYNLRGQYYTTPIDTIGAKVSSDEDFVYTQQIQKYYNPTIVLDNSQLLADVLQNSYGNVEIVYNGLTPTFLPTYGYGWPYYSGYYNPWAWNIGGWGWSIGGWYDPWYWGPSWSWGWGPSWAWGPSWSWGWGPSWGWGGPGWGPGPGPAWGGPSRPGSTWSPAGNRPVSPGSGWAGGSHRNPNSNRPSGTVSRPGNTRPASSGSQWGIGGNRPGNITSGNGSSTSGNNRGYINGHRTSGSRNTGVSSGSSTNTRPATNTTTNRNNSYNNSNRNSNSTRNSGSYNNSNRSSGNGSFGSGSFGGGHRSSGGGGGGRGGRR